MHIENAFHAWAVLGVRIFTFEPRKKKTLTGLPNREELRRTTYVPDIFRPDMKFAVKFIGLCGYSRPRDMLIGSTVAYHTYVLLLCASIRHLGPRMFGSGLACLINRSRLFLCGVELLKSWSLRQYRCYLYRRNYQHASRVPAPAPGEVQNGKRV